MRQNLREVPNHLNLILSSNQPNSMRIEANDRRFNVCPRQEAKLLTPGESGDEFVEQIRAELQAFADYLISHEADKAKARDALENDVKRQLQAVTTTAIEEVADAMRKGNLEYFFDHRPLSGGPFGLRLPSFDGRDVNIRTVYREFLDQALRQAKAGKKHVIQHEHLFAVFELLVGDMPKTKTKLTKRLGHVNLAVATHSQGNKSIRGFGVEWVAGPTKVADWSAALAQEENDFERSNQVQGRRLVRQVSDPKDNSNGTDQ
jgi:hypothetical protein